MTHSAYKVTETFEQTVAEYTGAKYAVAVDNATNGIFLCLKYLKIKNQEITIPARTFMSVPCTIIQTGNKVKFDHNHSAIKGKKLRGEYQLSPTPACGS